MNIFSLFLFIFASYRFRKGCDMKIRILFVLLAAWGCASCVSVQTIAFDQLCPAKFSVPEQVKSVAVLNNMPSIPEAKGNVATLGNLNGDGKQTAEAFADALADSKYFNQVIICDSVLNEEQLSDTEIRSLPHEDVIRLAQDLGADMLFSLDRVFLQNEKKSVIYPGLTEPWPVIVTRVTPVVSVYSPMRTRPLQVIVPRDSIEWNLDRMPSDRELLRYVAELSADVLAHQVVPYWERTERLYFAGGCVEMRDAAVCVKEGDWEGAKALWLSLYEHRKSEKVKARAALNLALASEMLDDLEAAQQWLDEAKKRIEPGSDEDRVYKYFTLKLEEKRMGFPHLQIQMKRFENNLSE